MQELSLVNISMVQKQYKLKEKEFIGTLGHTKSTFTTFRYSTAKWSAGHLDLWWLGIAGGVWRSSDSYRAVGKKQDYCEYNSKYFKFPLNSNKIRKQQT